MMECLGEQRWVMKDRVSGGVWFLVILAGSCTSGRQPSAAGLSALDTTSYQRGRLTARGVDGITAMYQYDARGRPTAVDHAIEAKHYVQTSTFGYPRGSAGPNAGTVVVRAT